MKVIASKLRYILGESLLIQLLNLQFKGTSLDADV